MVLTRSFKALVQKRAATEPAFAEALLSEGVNALLAGDVGVGTSLLRDYIAATIGFETLSQATGTDTETLIRMFGPHGSPQARDLFGIIGQLQKQAGIALHVMVEPGRLPGDAISP